MCTRLLSALRTFLHLLGWACVRSPRAVHTMWIPGADLLRRGTRVPGCGYVDARSVRHRRGAMAGRLVVDDDRGGPRREGGETEWTVSSLALFGTVRWRTLSTAASRHSNAPGSP